jgi:DNA-directed RNA polymerase subunit omega
MARVFVEDALKKSGVGQHELIVMAAKRAREIQAGSAPLVKSESRKPTVLALQEIEEGLYTMDHFNGTIKSAEQLAEEANQKEADDEYQFTQGE